MSGESAERRGNHGEARERGGEEARSCGWEGKSERKWRKLFRFEDKKL